MKKAHGDLLVVDMEEKLLLFNAEANTFEPLEDFEKILEDVWVITNFGNTPPRFQWVETPPKYAEILAQRQLQETGELEEGAQIISHWKKSSGKTTSQIFSTAIPKKAYLTHGNRAKELETHYLLFPCNALLFACLKHFTTAQPQDKQGATSQQKNKKSQKKKKKQSQKVLAIMFEHNLHVDILVGRANMVIGTGRISSFANTPEAKESLASSANAELRNIMESSTHKVDEIVHFTWILPKPGSDMDALQKNHGNWVTTLANQTQTETVIMVPQSYNLPKEEILFTSLPEALQHLSDSDSTATLVELAAYRTQQLMPWTILIMLVIIIGMGATTLWLHTHNTTLNAEYLALRDDSNAAKPIKVKPIDKNQTDVIAYVKRLERWQRASSFSMLLSELSSARVDKLFFDRVTVEFDADIKAIVTLTGAIESSFQTANKGHEIFLEELSKRNFKVIRSNFATDVTQLTFEIVLERPPK